jgi:outer membrane receptor protein involved in Fe transport
MMKGLVLVFAVFLSIATQIVSAQGVISGRVYDNVTLEPLPGVYILHDKGQVTLTGPEGTFLLRADSSKLNITFKFIGYKPLTRRVDITSGSQTVLDVGLSMEIREIGQIVVSANKTEQRIAELTVSMDVLKSIDFLKTHITDSEELINKTPGIEVLDGQASIRGGSGFSYGAGSRVMALIDGLPVLSPDAGSIKWQFLPMENISQIEIIKGASSVLYGSSALNGIINFRTADATNIPQTKFYAETGIYGNPNNKDWKWRSSPLVFSNVSFSHLQKFGKTDIGLGFNILLNEGYRKYNDEKLGRLSLNIKHHNEKVKGLVYGMNINSGYTSKIDFVLWEDATHGALKQDTSSASRLHGNFIAIDPFISYDNHRKVKHDLRTRFQSTANKFPVRSNNNSEALSFYGEYKINYKAAEFLNIAAGITENYSKIISLFYGDHTGNNTSAFTQMEVSPVAKLKLVAGVRLEQNSLDKENDKIVPVFRSGVNWQAADYTFLRASFGQGYRYPSIAEKFASTTLGAVKIFPNPFVKPESGWSSEIGVKQGILIGSISGQADISFFLSQNSDMIEYVFSNYPDPVTGIFDFGFQATNVEQSRVYGYELEFTLNRSFNNFNTVLNGGYTYIYPVEYNPVTNNNTDIFLKYRRKHSLKLSLNTSFKKADFGFDLYYRSKILNIDDVFVNPLTRESILPGFYDYWLENNKGYLLLDCNAGYAISKQLSVSLVIKNITNTEYMGRPGDIQPQRNLSLRLSGTF